MNVSASWEARFRAFVVNDFSLAVDAPDRGVVAAGGIEPHQLHAWDRRTGTLRPVTNGPNGILAGVISTDGRWVYYVDDAASETGVLVRVPFQGGGPVAIDPDLPAGSILGWGVAPGRLAFTLVVEDRFEHRIAEDGRPGSRLVASTGTTSWINGFADGGDTLIVIEERPSGEKDTLLLDVATGTERARAATPGASTKAYTPSPIPGDRRFLAESDESGVPRPFLWDRDTDERVPIPVDGLEGDVRPLAWSPDGRSILLLQVSQARMTLHLHDLDNGGRRALTTPQGAITALPVTFATEFASANEILTIWQNGAHPAGILSIPLDGEAPSLALGDPAPPPGHPWRSVRFTSRDGTAIQGWLAVPSGDRGPGPAVVDIHGGPGVAQFDEYLPHLAAFVDHGFAVLSLNYRSSNTFGRAFEEATIGRVGELELEDIAAAREFLVTEGLADPARVMVEGWSWGGYLTLLALGRQPDQWAGGICGVGIGDMAAQHDEAVEYIAQMIARQHGGTPAQVPERYRASSPITYAETVTAPLLVIHGTDDIRCPAGQMERYLARMAELGKDVTAEWFSAGHLGGIADPALFMGQTGRMLAFADRIVGG